MTSVSYATIGASRGRGSIAAVCLVAALVMSLAPCAAAQLTASSGVTQRYGNFSIAWPAQPRLLQRQQVSGGVATIYVLTGSPYTYTFSFLQFSSPQEMVTPQDFARNQTSNPPGETILSVSATKLAGYPADEVIYRIGQETHMAWSVQPTPEVNYVITAAGADSAAFRRRAQQFAASFGKAGNRE